MLGRNEAVPRHVRHGIQHLGLAYAPSSDLALDHIQPRRLVSVTRHAPTN